MKRPISCIFVVNPPRLGRRRRRIFEKQFENWPKRPPPVFYVGVNKNFMGLTESSEYRHLIIDDRSRWTKLKLRFGLERRQQDYFRRTYDPLLCQADWVTEPVEIGRVANALSHVNAWKNCRHRSEDEVCMIVEDDALINPEIEFDGIEWPETADLLHLWPGGIGFYEGYSDDYVRVLQKWKKGGCNWTSIGYIITPACARRFLSKLVPHIVNRTIDMEILYRGTPHVFAVRKPWVMPTYRATSLVAQPTKLHSLARAIFYRLRFLLPHGFRKRHPFLLESRKHRRGFDEPRLG